MIGTVLKHRYEVLEKIGEGNLFTVYKCDDKVDNRPVAVKVLLPQYAANRMFAERILVEAQAMVGVSHPGIVEVYDSGEENGAYYAVVEYVRGVDLKERIRRGAPFSLATAVDTGLAVCDVLDSAHRKGFVHGDLRPGNILVTPEGQIKLADFWVSGAVASAQSIRTNALMRSIHYMAPETAEGKPMTPAADIYSVGVMLFELLTGTLPFDGDTPIAIALKHAREPVPSLRAMNPGVPKGLEAMLMKALRKAPEDRFRSAKAMLNELKSVKEALNLAKPVAWPRPAGEEHPEQLADAVDEVYEPGDAEPMMLSVLKKALLAVVAFLAVLLALVMILVWRSPADVRVPELLGKTLVEAQQMASENDIQLSVRSEQYNEAYPKGAIYYSHPGPGRIIKAGKKVDVWISKGSRFATTPNVVKLPLEDAKQRIYDANLNVGEISQEYSDSIPAGNIMGQSPSPGTRQEHDEPVNLVFSLGPEPGEAPVAPETTSSGRIRPFDVKFTVPQWADGQKVQIIVEDDYGENIVYSETARRGDRIEQTIRATGDKVTIRIYIDGRLVREEQK